MELSEAEDGMGYIVVATEDEDMSLQPGDRVKVYINDGSKIVFRILGADERYSVSCGTASGVTIRKA